MYIQSRNLCFCYTGVIVYRIRYFFRRLFDFPRRLRKAWPYFKFYLSHDWWDIRYLITSALALQLRIISKEIIKDENYDNKKHDLQLLWQCRKALDKYREDAAEDVAYQIDMSLFKNKFKIDMPKAIFASEDGKTQHVVYKYLNTVDEETKKQVEEYLSSKERHASLAQNYRSLNSAYLQDFLNKLGIIIDSLGD